MVEGIQYSYFFKDVKAHTTLLPMRLLFLVSSIRLWQKKNSPLQKMNAWINLILTKNGKIGAIKRALEIEDSES